MYQPYFALMVTVRDLSSLVHLDNGVASSYHVTRNGKERDFF